LGSRKPNVYIYAIAQNFSKCNFVFYL
jgi:hypothetical protein